MSATSCSAACRWPSSRALTTTSCACSMPAELSAIAQRLSGCGALLAWATPPRRVPQLLEELGVLAAEFAQPCAADHAENVDHAVRLAQ